MPDYQHIHVRVEDRVARIAFARPPLNVFNIDMMREIAAAIGECARRDLVAIVFEADKSCRAFSAKTDVFLNSFRRSIEYNHAVAASHQPLRHVAAHSAEADHRELHRLSVLSV